MKTKTAYRPKPDAAIPQPDRPANIEPELNPEPIIQAEPKSDTPVEQKPTEPEESEATKRLKQQLADLERSGALNRQNQAPAPPSREQLLDNWRQQGMSDANLKFLADNPELVDGWQLTTHAAHEATRHGHALDTEAHREATKAIFHEYLAKANEQMAPQPTPEFFRPPPAPRQPGPPSKAAIVSAPPSRETPGSRAYQSENDPRSVRLTPGQREAAAIAGITETEYARQLIRMKKMQASGEIQG